MWDFWSTKPMVGASGKMPAAGQCTLVEKAACKRTSLIKGFQVKKSAFVFVDHVWLAQVLINSWKVLKRSFSSQNNHAGHLPPVFRFAPDGCSNWVQLHCRTILYNHPWCRRSAEQASVCFRDGSHIHPKAGSRHGWFRTSILHSKEKYGNTISQSISPIFILVHPILLGHPVGCRSLMSWESVLRPRNGCQIPMSGRTTGSINLSVSISWWM